MLIYDGDCAFCTTCADWLEGRLPLGYPVVPWQHHPDLSAIGLTEHDVATAAYWIDVDGRAHRGADGIARLLVACGGGWSLVGWFLLIPPIAWAASGLYRLVARYRHRLPGGTPACQLSR